VLKSRLEGARLTALAQMGSDRIVRFSFQKGGEILFLDAKLWGNGSNIILSSAEGIIIDTFSRRPNRKESPGEVWPPEGIGKQPPPEGERFAPREFPGEGGWNRRVERYYAGLEIQGERERHGQLWSAWLEGRTAALDSRERDITGGIRDFSRQAGDGHWGDIIMAHLHELKAGMKVLEADDWNEEGSKVIIPLDPKLSPAENAEAYYRRRSRAARGLERLNEDLEALRRTRTGLDRLKIRVGRGDFSEPPLDTDPPSPRGARSSPESALPGIWFRRGPFIIAAGRTSAESEYLLRHWAKGNDTWLHVRDWPGGHVFVRSPGGKSIPLEILLDAGNLALSYSKARTSGEADLYYTQVKYLRRARDGRAGTVLPTREKNLRIRLDPERLTSLKAAAAAF
jgi:predicted ribosome quality control (RQC) complex YloA/Tae2 family protein